MASPSSPIAFDPEYRTLRRLAEAKAEGIPEQPLDALQQVADLARELTSARYGVLVMVDAEDRVEGVGVSGMAPDDMKGAPLGDGPLGGMRQDGRSVRIDDLGAQRELLGVPAELPEMKTLLASAIQSPAAIRGALYVIDRDDGARFDDGDEVVLQMLSRHAAKIIEERWTNSADD